MGASKTWTNSPGQGSGPNLAVELAQRSQFEYEDHPFQPGIAGASLREAAGSGASTLANVSFARLTAIRLDRDLRQFRRERDEMPRHSAH